MKNLLDALDTVVEIRRDLNTEQSTLDKKIIDLTHIIEYCSLNAVEMSKVYIELRNTLRERREVKESLSALQSFYDRKETFCSTPVVENMNNRHLKYKKESNENLKKYFFISKE